MLSGLVLLAALACHQSGYAAAASPVADVPTSNFSGKVIETTNSGGYTYIRIDTGKAKVWAAAPKFAVKVGDPVAIGQGMPMNDYHSKTMNRDFDMVIFTGSITVGDTAPGGAGGTLALPEGHPPIAGAGAGVAAKPSLDVAGIKKAEGGKTVAEIFADKAKLKGKEVKVRGRVVKYNGGIMGKNWIHIQDGTGTVGSNDLTITSSDETKLGDVILVTGKVATDRDFGGNYKYSILIEDAKLKAE
jgi:hypothetical protein